MTLDRWTVADAEQLRDHFEALRQDRKLQQLFNECKSTTARGYEALNEVSRSQFYRYADFGTTELFNKSKSDDFPELLFQYLSARRLFGSTNPQQSDRGAFLKSAGSYFQTRQSKFDFNDLRHLCGSYTMYRRNWRTNNSVSFMTSHVNIWETFKEKSFSFRETQYWPKSLGEDEWREIDSGYLFPSGQTILAVCRSTKGNNTKFLSISKLDPSPFSSVGQIRSFSGTGIATSDTPPHIGYGFHCIRTSYGKPSNHPSEPKGAEIEKIFRSESLNEAQLNERNFDILRNILYHEGQKEKKISENGGS
ncbi:MAG: hypothetical protein P1U33_08465 [Litorivicinaceae bacterium]|uniref:hypothetical protein n=1 Tax=Thalassovita sp. TaxID=1979401 RepID=UPI002802BE03|nr:hypothetical protein [Thalassovita sp.]MDF1784180.1 hypothetical protein [Litorivicinaceae bacterium]MDF1803169.1 hypothetical protein [Thalassovita sp.]